MSADEPHVVFLAECVEAWRVLAPEQRTSFHVVHFDGDADQPMVMFPDGRTNTRVFVGDVETLEAEGMLTVDRRDGEIRAFRLTRAALLGRTPSTHPPEASGAPPAAQPAYDVALSFAGEQREYVRGVAGVLADVGVAVFYDDYEKVDLWGKDLYEHLSAVYSRRARYTVMFVSQHYAAKVWPRLERRAAQERALRENDEYILPVRFDDTEVPGLSSNVGYLDARVLAPGDVAGAILVKLGREPAHAATRKLATRRPIVVPRVDRPPTAQAPQPNFDLLHRVDRGERHFGHPDVQSAVAGRAFDNLVADLLTLTQLGYVGRVITAPNGMSPHGQYYVATVPVGTTPAGHAALKEWRSRRPGQS